MSITIPVAHDFNCPWCWIALSQVKRIRNEFDIDIDWRGYELYPDSMEWPDPVPKVLEEDRRPKTPGRLALALAAEGLAPLRKDLPPKMRTHRAHLAVEFAKTKGVQNSLIERLYEAYWLDGLNINELSVIEGLCEGLIEDMGGLRDAVRYDVYSDRIVEFDEPAYQDGVYYVPTFWIDGERYAEQPYTVIRQAIASVAVPLPGIYTHLELPNTVKDRPYVAINMAATVDGRVSFGEVSHLGSKTDIETMRRIESQFDAVLIGAETLRVAPLTWYPRTPKRYVITRSNNVPAESAFFNPANGIVGVISPNPVNLEGIEHVHFARENSLRSLLQRLHQDDRVRTLLVEGGPTLNGQLLEENLVDEVFLTVTPSLALGSHPKTIAETKISPNALVALRLVECRPIGDEVFLRYRRA